MIFLSNKIRILLFLVSFALFAGCGNNKEKISFTVKGKLSNSNNEWVVVYRLLPKKILALDSMQLDDSGNFNLIIHSNQTPELLLFKVNKYPERITLLTEDKDIITITGDALNLNKTYSATGNKGTKALRTLTHTLNKYINNADSIYLSYRRLVNDSNGTYLKKQTDSLLNNNYLKTYEFVVDFCKKNKNNLAGIVGLYSRYGENPILDYTIDFNIFSTVSKAINEQYPNNEHALNLKKFVDNKYQLLAHADEVEKGLEAGNKAPDIIRPNPEGEQIEMSSFQGKYLVLAFWSATKKASWDMNAGLKTIAKKYKNKKVALLSVSMDKDKLQWVNTIAIDHLKWNHVLSNESVDNAYDLKDESRLFLIDKQGVIIAKDLSTDSLDVLLNQALNN